MFERRTICAYVGCFTFFQLLFIFKEHFISPIRFFPTFRNLSYNIMWKLGWPNPLYIGWQVAFMRPLQECVPLSILVSDRVELALFGAPQKFPPKGPRLSRSCLNGFGILLLSETERMPSYSLREFAFIRFCSMW